MLSADLFLRLAAWLLLSGAALGSASSAWGDTLLDSFDGRTTVAPWIFSNGPEFPGATGSLTIGTGHTGQGAHLAYNLAAGGSYVEAALVLPTPVAAAAISFWVRSPANVFVSLRVTDATGQTLQYRLNRPLTALATPSAWYQQVVPLDGPTLWFSGANNGILHNPIQAVAILAGNPLVAGPVDAIDFDDVTAVTTTTAALQPDQTLIGAPAGSGNLLQGMGVNIHFTNDPTALDAAQAAGFTWARMDLTWANTEKTPGVYNWAPYDGLIADLASRSMHALLILDYGNALYTGGSLVPPTSPAAITAYANFAQAAAAHFAGTGTRFEIWNEPNIAAFWTPTTNPSQYAAMAAAATAAVHVGDPNAEVTCAGLSGFDNAFAQNYLNAGGSVGAQAIAVHPYDVTYPAGILVDKLVLFQSIDAQLANPLPLWQTEWGFSSVDFSPAGTVNGHDPTAQRLQGQFASMEMLAAFAAGFPLFVYYDLRDDGIDATNEQDNFGLLGSNNAPKPAYTAIQTLANVARGRTFSGFVPMAPTSVVAMRFDGARDQVIALWSAVLHSSVSVTLPAGASATDFLGNPLNVASGTVTISEANGPVYVTLLAQARLTNLSVRSTTGAGANQLIVGFGISGAAKSVLIRGDGPALTAFGVADALASVDLTLFDSSQAVLATNNGWADASALALAASRVGAFAFATGSKDSALLQSLPPGAYTAGVTGPEGTTGVALAEIYDAELGVPIGRLTNASARTLVGTGADIMIAGFTIGGTGAERLLVRAIGPGLTAYGVTGVLQKPSLTIFNASQQPIYQNTGWSGTSALSTAFAAVGAFPLAPTSPDSALLVTLAPGSYTAEVQGADGGTGVALVEVYEEPPAN